MRLASSSFTNARLAGSQVTLRPSWHAMYAQWEVTWALQVDSALARGSDRDRMQSSQFWMWREGSVPLIVTVWWYFRRLSDISILPESPVSIQPSVPSKRTRQVPRSPQPSPRKTSFTPLRSEERRV